MGRGLSIAGFIGISIVYLVIIQGFGKVLTAGIETEYAAPTSVDALWRSISVPVFLSLLFVYAVVAVLGWWRPVFKDDKPVQRWLLVIPIIMVVAIVIGTNWAGLVDRGPTFAGVLIVSTLMVGFAEEGMFRGIGVVAFRRNGSAEGKVALWTCILFGLAHATNIFTEGSKALLQVLVTVVAGYFFYLIRRRSGGLVLAAILHGFWDLGVISGGVVPGKTYVGTALFILADIVILVILLARRRHIEPEVSTAST